MAEVSLFEEVAQIKEVKTSFASALETYVTDPSHTPISFSVVAKEFHAVDLDKNHILDDLELILYLAGETRVALETAFPPKEDAKEGFLSYESFKKNARFDEPTDCESYISQTDSSSEDIWRALTDRGTDMHVNRDQLVITLAMMTKESLAPGAENNCVDFDFSSFPEEANLMFANCKIAKLEGGCKESSPFHETSQTFCSKTCGFCQPDQDIAETKWTIEDFFKFHTSDQLMDSWSALTSDRELIKVDEFTHETKPEWEEKCKAVRRQLVHPCIVTAAVGAVAGAITGGVIQCKNTDATMNYAARCAVRGVLGGAISGALIGGLACASLMSIMRLWTTATVTHLGDKAFTIAFNGLSIHAATSEGTLNDGHTLVGNTLTWSFQSVSNDQKWYEFGSWWNPFGRRE